MIVLDPCAACEMARRTEEGLALWSLLIEEEDVVSCNIMTAELISIVRKLRRKGSITPSVAYGLYHKAQAIVDEFYPIEELQDEVLSESIRLDHSAYDMFYFVLARRLGATLFTLDRKLMNLCADNGVNCVDLSDI